MIIFSMIFLRPILRLLGATDSIMPYAMTYAGIYVVSCIFNVFNVTMNNIVTSEGAAKTTMFALMAGVFKQDHSTVYRWRSGNDPRGDAVAAHKRAFLSVVWIL